MAKKKNKKLPKLDKNGKSFEITIYASLTTILNGCTGHTYRVRGQFSLIPKKVHIYVNTIPGTPVFCKGGGY